MNWKPVTLTAILLLIALAIIVYAVSGCSKQTNPVSSLNHTFNRIATIVTPGEPEFSCVYGDTVFVADNQSGIAVLGLSPSPHYLSNYRTGSYGQNVFRGVIWVGYDSSSHHVVGADRPSTTNRLLNKFVVPRSDSLIHWAYEYHDSLTYFDSTIHRDSTIHWDEVTSFDVTNSPSTTLFYQGFSSPHFVNYQSGFSVGTLDTIFDHHFGWIRHISYTTPYNTPTLSHIDQAVVGDPYTFAAASEYGFVSLHVVDWNTTPTEVGHVDLPGSVNWIAKRDTICYATTTLSGIGVIGVSDPTNPHLLTVVPVPNSDNQYQIEVSTDGKWLFLLDNFKGVYVFSLSNPGNPQSMGLLDIQRPVGMCVAPNTLVVCSEAEGVVFFQW